MSEALVIDGLCVNFNQHDGIIAAVKDVSLTVAAHECVGVLGESGSGKTQLFTAAMGLLPDTAAVQGRIRFEGQDILGVNSAALNRVRGSRVCMIFQDPMTSLTPHLTIGTQLAEVLVEHRGVTWRAARLAALRMLERVRMPQPGVQMTRYPHELSGGMRQRVVIGMSLMCEPSLVIADEPTTALDVTVQAQIIELLRTMRAEMGMALVLISHDLAVVAGLAQRILVMYAGRIVECARAEDLLHSPRHPYTGELLKCLPRLSAPRTERMSTLPGQPPRGDDADVGCAFAPRCPRAAARCRIERPALLGIGDRLCACHFPLAP